MRLKKILWHQMYGIHYGYIGEAQVCVIEYKQGRYRVTAFGPNFQRMSWAKELEDAKTQAPAFVEKVLLELFQA